MEFEHRSFYLTRAPEEKVTETLNEMGRENWESLGRSHD